MHCIKPFMIYLCCWYSYCIEIKILDLLRNPQLVWISYFDVNRNICKKKISQNTEKPRRQLLYAIRFMILNFPTG